MVEKKGIEQNRALVPATKSVTKAIVVSAVRNALTGTGKHLGVSRNWLIQHVEKLGLDQDQVETLVAVRTDYGGLLPHAVKFLYQGLTAEDVHGCYRTQRELAYYGKQFNASITKIAKLVRRFAEADPSDKYLAEAICEAHDAVSKRYFWVHYVDQTISILCAVAERNECTTIEAAISMIESRQPKWDGVVNDDEEDEVERQRRDYEERRERHL